MPIIKSTYSGWQITGEDAEAFLRQIDSPPNPLALAAIIKGQHYVEEYDKKGYVSVGPNRRYANLNSAEMNNKKDEEQELK